MEALTDDPAIDGIVAADDFMTQGVLDARAKKRKRIPEDISFVGVINKMSRISSPYVFTRLVADGKLAGQETALLIDNHIRNPKRAPRRVLLNCQLSES